MQPTHFRKPAKAVLGIIVRVKHVQCDVEPSRAKVSDQGSKCVEGRVGRSSGGGSFHRLVSLSKRGISTKAGALTALSISRGLRPSPRLARRAHDGTRNKTAHIRPAPQPGTVGHWKTAR
jgi:hypothetical protein